VDIFRETIFRPLGGARPEIFTLARDWPMLRSAHPNWDGGPPKNFNRENLKFGLKFSVCTSITSGLGISSQILIRTMCRELGVIMWVQFLDDMSPKIWDGEKRSKSGAIPDNFRLWSRISPERIHKSKIEKVVHQLRPLQRWRKKWVNFGPQTNSYWRAYWPIQVDVVGRLYFGPYGMMCPQIFYTR